MAAMSSCRLATVALFILAAVPFLQATAATEDETPANTSSTGSTEAESVSPETAQPHPTIAHSEATSAEAVDSAIKQALQDLDDAMANVSAQEAATSSSSNLRATSGWGHGGVGETCCMCHKYFGFTTILFAAEDYTQVFGNRAANWWCNLGCAGKCRAKGGLMFGCYDEQHLLQMDQMYGYRADYRIMHDTHYGNIC